MYFPVTADTAFWIFLGGLPLVGITAIAAKALRLFSRHRLDSLCRRREAPERFGQILRQHGRVGRSAEHLTLLIVIMTISMALQWISGLTQVVGEPFTAAAALVMVVLAMFMFFVWIPTAVVDLWAEGFLYWTWPVWRALDRLLTPLVAVGKFVDVVLHRLAGRPRQPPDEEAFEDEIRSIVTEGHREGLLEEDAREMIEGVIELGDCVVTEVMTPRTDMVSMHVGLSLEDAARFAVESAHSRIPVYDKNRDDIVGILYAKDMLPEFMKPEAKRADDLLQVIREAHFVPETKPVDALLEEFQQTRNHMAIVLDEYGGVSGLVTIEDVLEEIVGEIVDEYDPDLVEGIRRIDDRTCELLARVHIDEVNERLHVNLPDDDDFDTIGGFVLSRLGRVPAVGEEVRWENIRLTVLDVTTRRIERVRLEILDPAHQASA